MKHFLKRIADYMDWHRTHWVRLAPEYHQELFGFFALLKPQKVRNKSKIRVGISRDGGYVMVNDFAEIQAAISLGIGPNVSWDLEIAGRGIRVFQFDHTVERPPENHALFNFAKKKISTETAENCVTLDSVITSLCQKRFVLKMDIEGDEWAVLDHLDLRLLGNCAQFVVELHDLGRVTDLAWCERAKRVLSRLNKTFQVIHIHGNNLSKHLLAGGFCLPDCVEVTFVNRRVVEVEETAESFPGPLDQMNNPYFPDFKLDRIWAQQRRWH
jgi:hypothetical protein